MKEFRRVYMGGHHEVYCNDSHHIYIHGGVLEVRLWRVMGMIFMLKKLGSVIAGNIIGEIMSRIKIEMDDEHITLVRPYSITQWYAGDEHSVKARLLVWELVHQLIKDWNEGC